MTAADRIQHVVVVGGGVVGTMCGWYLREAGYRVTIIDQGALGQECSHGNCGFVCPSHVLPLAVPGAIRSSLRTLLQRNSPFTIKLRLSPTLWKWLWKFAEHCNRPMMLETADSLHPLLQHSLRLYHELITAERIDCEWEDRGLLFVYATQREFEHYASTDRLLTERYGVSAKPFPAGQLVELEPALKPNLGGAWHYCDDCHLRPDRLMSSLRERLVERGVTIVEHFQFEKFVVETSWARGVLRKPGSAANIGQPALIEADAFVVATGAWAPFLSRELGCQIPIQPGKGYSLTMPKPAVVPRIPMIFEEHRVAVTPFQSSYRIGSTMEFAGYDRSINGKRLGLLRTAAEHYLREPYCEPVTEEWFGWRPMTWDSRPIIDRSPRLANVWIAAGHSMLGLTLATATGHLIADLIAERRPLVDPNPFRVSRFA